MIQPIQGMAYVPGTVRGVLSKHARPDGILLANQQTLSEMQAWPKGCVLVNGAPFSHATIGLLSHGIPTVILNAAQAKTLEEGMSLIVDGASGWLHPAHAPASALTPTPPAAPTPLFTRDDCRVELRASVRDSAGAARARDRGAAAIGLVRTEFLLPDRGAAPDAAFYRTSIRTLCEAAAPLDVTLRLLDLAPDKHPSWAAQLPRSTTLGMQGARLFDHRLVHPVVVAQLEALETLCVEFPLRILIPYLTKVEEFLRWRTLVEKQLTGKSIEVGAMIETPAAAMLIAEFANSADFVGIGTNDLMQCLSGADRDDPDVASYLDPYSPAIYRFLRTVAQQAEQHIHRIQLCGVLSQLPGTLPVLLGLGYRAFSVDTAHLPYLAQTVVNVSSTECLNLAHDACAAKTSRDVAVIMGVPVLE